MEEKKILEEQLREAACIGDTDAVQELISLGVDVNARHAINGWTPLHWACKRNYLDVVVLLLKSGADSSAKSNEGETPASVSTNPYVLRLLGAPPNFPCGKASSSDHDAAAAFVPNYLKNPPLGSKVDTGYLPPREIGNIQQAANEDVVLKVRVANANDPDFIEVDVQRNALTYENLIKVCCQELQVDAAQIIKLRKLPNTKLRRDKDVQRLEDYQEIELVLHGSQSVNESTHNPPHANGSTVVPITPTNNYQSISKRDQTILY